MAQNNKFLIDTHIFIWWMEKSKSLSPKTYDLLKNPQTQVFVSVASIWEMIFKKERKKLKFSINLEDGLRKTGFTLLPITLTHVLELQKLPMHHNDPFDRIIIAQSKAENIIFISDDAKIKVYDVKIL